MNSALGHDIFLRLFSFLPESLLEHDLLGLVLVLGPVALWPAGTAAAIFAPVPGGGHKLSIPHLRCLPPQRQLPALYTGKTV